MKVHLYLAMIAGLLLTASCGDPSRPAAREAAELEEGRIIEHPREGADTTINKTAGGGTGVRIYESDSIIERNRPDEPEARIRN
ncbi:hypothetical protein RCC89_16835 [Cytophagaceae bacterium ABcell3]|nr:hypothetical protein RCC89_16835 [Cytophagaceae bacterium ABcell3]